MYAGKDHIYDLNTLDTNGNPVVAKSDMNIIQHYPPLRHYQVRIYGLYLYTYFIVCIPVF